MSDMFERAKSRLLDRFESPRDLLEFRLGAALTMETTVLEMLIELADQTLGGEPRRHLLSHAEETRGHVDNLERAYAALGLAPDDRPCPTIEAIDKEGRANARLADERMVDDVILCAAAETEHHEIAMYETLIAHADGLAEHDVARLLRENLEQERHALGEIQRLMRAALEQLAGHTR